MLIQRMRDRSQGMLAKIIVAAIIFVFALFGFGSITTFLIPVPKVATVNGEDITEQEMMLAVERRRQVMRANAGTDSLDIDEEQLTDSTLDDLIERQLLMQEVSELDLFYAEARLDQDIINTPAFQVDGRFDQARFQLMLRGVGYTPITYREAIKSELMFQQISTGIAGTNFMTKPEIRRYVSLAQQKRDIAYLRVEVEQLKEGVEIADEEVEAYYRENPGEFYTEEVVNLQYIELEKSDLANEVEVDDAELASLYEGEKENFAGAVERRVAHILIEVSEENDEEAARGLATSLYDRIQAGESFAELAMQYSDDPGSAEQGGDLGFNLEGSFVPEFEEVAWSLAPGEVSGPVQTEFGFHIIKLIEVSEPEIPTFEEMRDRLEQQLRSARAEEIFVERSARLAELGYESADLSVPAADLGLTIQQTGFFSRTSGSGLTAHSAVIDAAFSEDLLVDGNNSDLIEVDPDHHVVVRVLAHKDSELQPLADVAGEIRDRLATDRAREAAVARADEIVAMLESGSITRFVADQFGLEWVVTPDVTRNAVGVEPAIAAAAFELPRPREEGKSIGKTVLPDGDAVVISVTRVENGASDALGDEELRNLGRFLASEQGQGDYSEYREELRARADIDRL